MIVKILCFIFGHELIPHLIKNGKISFYCWRCGKSFKGGRMTKVTTAAAATSSEEIE